MNDIDWGDWTPEEWEEFDDLGRLPLPDEEIPVPDDPLYDDDIVDEFIYEKG